MNVLPVGAWEVTPTQKKGNNGQSFSHSSSYSLINRRAKFNAQSQRRNARFSERRKLIFLRLVTLRDRSQLHGYATGEVQ
jgi:hypothetical protein